MIGLTALQAEQALKINGPNLLPQKNGASALKIFISQIKNPFSFVLIAAALLSFLVGDRIDGILISSILILNTILGFWQEFKASKELEALRSFEVLASRVLRDGKEIELPSSQIVPQDVVILESGDKIPADGEILESFSLQVNESILTGESMPVAKTGKDGENELFFGTTVVSGRAKYLVTKTGIKTRFGGIAETLTEVEEEKTPLEISLEGFIKKVGIFVVVVAVGVLLLRVFQGFDFIDTLLISIALLVAAVPEGLPAVVTIVLAMGVHKMYQRNALVRKMIAVESLGSATIVLSDKTGTLTKNEMRVNKIESSLDSLDQLLRCAVLCNSASLVLKEDHGGYDVLGDSTEGALLLWAKDQNLDIELLRSEGKLVEEMPFSLESRMMTTIWDFKGKKQEFSKGAPEVIFQRVKLNEKELKHWDKIYQQMASGGLRVLAFAEKEKMLGLVGIADQIRSEAKEAIKTCKQAGIKVVMVTGDNALTAKAVAEQIGLLKQGDEILTGTQLSELDDEELKAQLPKIAVYARITPENKYRLVKAYQSLGEIVAVTGDGVNDALALKQAQVGVSMGKTGTDVSKEASDLVLLDDNFTTLISAIEQGRVIYNNILKVIKFLMTGNLSEILLISIAAVLALPVPLLPTQILWINFVSDGLPALALGFDNPSSNTMRVPPRKEYDILNPVMVRYILIGGVSIAFICLLTFWQINQRFGLQTARATTFTMMVVLQMCLPFIIRRHHSIFSNRKLLASVLLMLVFQILILTIPQLKSIFEI